MNSDRDSIFPRRMQNPGITLPNIRGGNDNDLKNIERALVPVNGNVSEMVEERLKHLETRLIVSEKSSRALLDEIVRLQSTIRSQLRRQDDLIREERQARQQLESTIKSNNDVVLELARRIQSTEEKVQDEKMTLSELVSQTKSVELAFRNSQLDNRRGDVFNRMREVQQQVDEMRRGKSEMEQLTMQLVDEIRTVKARVEGQAVEQNSLANEIRSRNKRLEDEYIKQMYESMKRTEGHGGADFNLREMRAQIDLRMAEMRELFVELKGRQDLETQERKITEQQLQIKYNEMSILLGEGRRLNRTMPNDDLIIRQVETAVSRERANLMQQWEIERSHIQAKVAELVEDLQRRIADRELRVRDEYSSKYNEIERSIRAEQEARSQYEKELRHESEKKWESFRKMAESQAVAVKDVAQDGNRYKDALQKIDEGVNILERLIEETRKNMEKILSAEIKSRKGNERELRAHLDNVEEKLGVATSSLQASLNALAAQISALEKQKREPAAQQSTYDDSQLIALGNRLKAAESRLDSRIDEVDLTHREALRAKLEALNVWRVSVDANIEELQELQQQVPKEIALLQEKVELLRTDIPMRIEKETNARIDDVDAIRRAIAKLREDSMQAGPARETVDPQVAKRVEECSQNIKTLTEALSTVKNILGMKLQSEQSTRMDEIRNLQDDFARLRVVVYQLVQQGVRPVDEDEDGEGVVTPVVVDKAKAEEEKKKAEEKKLKEVAELRAMADKSPPGSKDKDVKFHELKKAETDALRDRTPTPEPRKLEKESLLPAKPPPSKHAKPVEEEEEEEEEEEGEEEADGEEDDEEPIEEEEEEEEEEYEETVRKPAKPPARSSVKKPAPKR